MLTFDADIFICPVFLAAPKNNLFYFFLLINLMQLVSVADPA